MHTARYKEILTLALPIIGGMVSQNVLNLVDTAMVGRLENPDPALAAVSFGGFANFMCMALLLGISTGVQATASRRKGEGKLERLAVSLNAGILLVLMVAPLLSAALYFVVPHVYPHLQSDPEMIAHGVPYLQARVLAITFVAINFAFRGYWNAVNLSRLYMGTLITMHVSNIFFNWVFIYGNLGFRAYEATGAGMASALSTVVATTVYIYLGLKHARANGFLRVLPAAEEFGTLVKLSIPSGIQQLFFAAGFVVLFYIIGRIGGDLEPALGTMSLAAAGVLINIMLVAILPGIGLGLSSATLVGQALGRKDHEDAERWGWDVVKVGMVGLALLGVPMWLIPDLVLAPFLQEPNTLELARNPLRLVGLTIWFEAVGLILMNSLLGAGDSKKVMMVSIVAQWGVFLPIAFVAVVFFGQELMFIWAMQIFYRLGLSVVFSVIWKRGHWATIEV